MANTTGKHVAIVGGGLAGLATAAYLGRAGHRVTLFERSDSLGGRGATVERDGYLHNLGPHALYRGGAGTEVLAELGVSYQGNTPDLRGVGTRNGRAHTLPISGRSMLTTRLFGVRARVEVGRQFLALRRVEAGDSRTVRDWLDSEFSEPASRDYVEAIVRLATYANAPELTSLADAARQVNGNSAGVLYLDGGWQTLVAGLEEAALHTGVDIRRGARVERLTFSGPRVTGLSLAGGETLPADAAVLAVPPDVAAALTGNQQPLVRIAERAIPARAACLDLGLKRLPNPRRTFGLGIDGPFYFSAHSLWAKLAPDGRVLASVAKYLPAGEPRDPERDLAELEAFLDIVQPGWRALEDHRLYLPNMVVQSALPDAAAGGIAGRPAPNVAGLDGLFVAGDWVGQGGWLTDGTLGSARQASEAASAWLAAAPALAGVS